MNAKIGAIIGLVIGLIPLITAVLGGAGYDLGIISTILMFPALSLDFVAMGFGIVVWPIVATIIGAVIGHKLNKDDF